MPATQADPALVEGYGVAGTRTWASALISRLVGLELLLESSQTSLGYALRPPQYVGQPVPHAQMRGELRVIGWAMRDLVLRLLLGCCGLNGQGPRRGSGRRFGGWRARRLWSVPAPFAIRGEAELGCAVEAFLMAEASSPELVASGVVVRQWNPDAGIDVGLGSS